MVKHRKRRLKTQKDPNIFPNGPEIPMFFFVPRCPTTPTSFILTVSFWGLWIKRNTMWCTSSWLFLAGIGPCSFIGLFVALLALDSPSPLSWSAATKSRFMVMVSLLFCLAVLIKIHEAPDLFGVYVGWQVRSRILPELYWFEWCLLFLSASSVTPKEWVWYLLFWQLLQNNFFQNVSKAWGKDITFKYIYAYIHDTHVFPVNLPSSTSLTMKDGPIFAVSLIEVGPMGSPDEAFLYGCN